MTKDSPLITIQRITTFGHSLGVLGGVRVL